MPAIGKEPGEPVAAFIGLFVESSNLCGGTSGGWDAEQRRGETGSEHDHVIRAPARPLLVTASHRVMTCAAGRIHLFELLVGLEPDVPAVRRPERVGRPRGSWKDTTRKRIQFADP